MKYPIKEGTHIVRTKDNISTSSHICNLSGYLFRTIEPNDEHFFYERAMYKPDYGIKKGDYRLATAKEARACKRGCNHVTKLSKYISTKKLYTYEKT